MLEAWVRFLGWKIPWRRKWQLTPVFWPGKSHGQRSLAGYCPWGCKGFNYNYKNKGPPLLKGCSLNYRLDSLPLICHLNLCNVRVCVRVGGDLDGWDREVGERSKRNEIYVYVYLIHFFIQQEPTQLCRATIPRVLKKQMSYVMLKCSLYPKTQPTGKPILI